MRAMRAVHGAVFAIVLQHVAWSVDVDLFADGVTTWAPPSRVERCPIHKPFSAQRVPTASGVSGLVLVPPGDKKFSLTEATLPSSATMLGNSSTGVVLRYSAAPGASGVSLWRLRVMSASDHLVRFVHLFSIPAAGVTNETRYMPWADFSGQIIDRQKLKIINCKDVVDARCVMRRDLITHISLLESEDTVAHAVHFHQIILTTSEIHEHNAEQHHTEEQAALIWESEHKAVSEKMMQEIRDRRHSSTTTMLSSDANTTTAGANNAADGMAMVAAAQGVPAGLCTTLILVGAVVRTFG